MSLIAVLEIAVIAVLAGAAIVFWRRLLVAREEADGFRTAALRDDLTGLANYRALLTSLPEWVDAGHANGRRVAAVMVDFDGFKSVNSEYGHAVGDAVLHSGAATLQAAAGPKAQCYRQGGDELLVVIPGEDEAGAAQRAEHIRHAIARRNGGLPSTTVSCGVAQLQKDMSGWDLLDAADQALRVAKRKGRNVIVRNSHVTPEAAREASAPEIHAAKRAALELATAALLARDNATADHSDDVEALCVAIGDQLGLKGEDADELRAGAQMHDIGKVGIDERIINKPGPLDEDEWALIKEHTIAGERILRAVPELADVATIVRYSHERWDGQGYPDGIAGEDIPLASRIIFCADAFQAIRADRPYRRGRSAQAALAEVIAHSGTQFDPMVVDALEKAAVDASRSNGRPTRRALKLPPRALALLTALALMAGTAIAAPGVRHWLAQPFTGGSSNHHAPAKGCGSAGSAAPLCPLPPGARPASDPFGPGPGQPGPSPHAVATDPALRGVGAPAGGSARSIVPAARSGGGAALGPAPSPGGTPGGGPGGGSSSAPASGSSDGSGAAGSTGKTPSAASDPGTHRNSADGPPTAQSAGAFSPGDTNMPELGGGTANPGPVRFEPSSGASTPPPTETTPAPAPPPVTDAPPVGEPPPVTEPPSGANGAPPSGGVISPPSDAPPTRSADTGTSAPTEWSEPVAPPVIAAPATTSSDVPAADTASADPTPADTSTSSDTTSASAPADTPAPDAAPVNASTDTLVAEPASVTAPVDTPGANHGDNGQHGSSEDGQGNGLGHDSAPGQSGQEHGGGNGKPTDTAPADEPTPKPHEDHPDHGNGNHADASAAGAPTGPLTPPDIVPVDEPNSDHGGGRPDSPGHSQDQRNGNDQSNGNDHGTGPSDSAGNGNDNGNAGGHGKPADEVAAPDVPAASPVEDQVSPGHSGDHGHHSDVSAPDLLAGPLTPPDIVPVDEPNSDHGGGRPDSPGHSQDQGAAPTDSPGHGNDQGGAASDSPDQANGPSDSPGHGNGNGGDHGKPMDAVAAADAPAATPVEDQVPPGNGGEHGHQSDTPTPDLLAAPLTAPVDTPQGDHGGGRPDASGQSDTTAADGPQVSNQDNADSSPGHGHGHHSDAAAASTDSLVVAPAADTPVDQAVAPASSVEQAPLVAPVEAAPESMGPSQGNAESSDAPGHANGHQPDATDATVSDHGHANGGGHGAEGDQQAAVGAPLAPAAESQSGDAVFTAPVQEVAPAQPSDTSDAAALTSDAPVDQAVPPAASGDQAPLVAPVEAAPETPGPSQGNAESSDAPGHANGHQPDATDVTVSDHGHGNADSHAGESDQQDLPSTPPAPAVESQASDAVFTAPVQDVAVSPPAVETAAPLSPAADTGGADVPSQPAVEPTPQEQVDIAAPTDPTPEKHADVNQADDPARGADRPDDTSGADDSSHGSGQRGGDVTADPAPAAAQPASPPPAAQPAPDPAPDTPAAVQAAAPAQPAPEPAPAPAEPTPSEPVVNLGHSDPPPNSNPGRPTPSAPSTPPTVGNKGRGGH